MFVGALKPAGPQREGRHVVTTEGGAFKIEGLADGKYVGSVPAIMDSIP